MIFQYYVSLRNEHLVCAAERTLNLKRLVLPLWNRLDIEAFEYAYHVLDGTRIFDCSMCLYAPRSMMRAIGSYSKRFTELKLMCPFDHNFAKAIVLHTPQLKVLSLRCTIVFKEALIYLLRNLQHLEVLNLSHCLLVGDIEDGYLVVYRHVDDEIIGPASHLRNSLTCEMMTCPMCRIAVNQNDFLRWYDHEHGNWRMDEITSLTV